LRVPDALLGQAVKCPSCEATFNADAAPVPTDAIRESAESPVRPRNQSAPARDEPPSRPRPRLDDSDDDDYDEDDDEFEYRRRRRRSYLTPHRGGVILTLGIVSLVLLFTALVCFPFGGFIGIAPWTMGMSDLRKMREERMDAEGRGMTKAGMIMGIVATALNILMILGLVVALIAAP